MKIVLQREVEKLGAPGDVVDVADGYARNYLVPRGFATPASKGGVKHAERLRRKHQDRVQKEVVEAQAIAERLSSVTIRVAARAGEDGRLFGSVTVPHLADELQKAAGVTIDRKQVHMPEPIRSIGAHEVQVHLHPQVNATVTVEVVPQ
ncbi:MAG: 50S ribosomal protein L9 [Actinobacteria bacterium]|nr:50S ribosomal protein L9 [Actinomycetota bacterium]